MNYNLGNRVRNLRLLNCMSIETLAELSEMSVRGIGNIELNKADPKISSVKKIAKALNTTCGNLLDDDNELSDFDL